MANSFGGLLGGLAGAYGAGQGQAADPYSYLNQQMAAAQQQNSYNDAMNCMFAMSQDQARVMQEAQKYVNQPVRPNPGIKIKTPERVNEYVLPNKAARMRMSFRETLRSEISSWLPPLRYTQEGGIIR